MITSTAERAASEGALPDAFGRDLPWLVLSTGAAVVVYVTYLLTHPYPAFGAGLFLRIAEEIAAAGYGLPTTIGGYTAGGVPFAYPPLPFYLLAALVDLVGVDPVAVSRYLPGVFVVVALPPYYYAARGLLSSVPKAGLATTLLAVTPTVLRWHLSAGGVVRALAFLFVVGGLYAGVRLFETGERGKKRRWRRPWSGSWRLPSARSSRGALQRRRRWWWLVLGAVAFGLTLLSHPIYAVFFGVSYLALFWFLDRSPRGLAAGAVVAVGGFAVAAPWWTWAVSTHGVGVFAGAAGTHGGIGGGLHRIGAAFLAPLVPDAETPFYLAAYAGAAYLLYRRECLLPAWLVAAGYVVGKHRFLFVPGAMTMAVLVFDWVVPRVVDTVAGVSGGTTGEAGVAGDERGRLRRAAAPLTVATVVIGAATLGGLAGGGQLTIWHGGASQPATVDDDDRTAMAWVEGNAGPEATFVVLGDAAEWFPLLADRPILVGHWGAEWEGADEYRRQLALYRSVSACGTERCVTETLLRAGIRPDYVYVPKGAYTIRGEARGGATFLAESMADADRYELVYENEGVAILRVNTPSERPEDDPAVGRAPHVATS